MQGNVIGKAMPHGYAGWYSRQPDMIIDTHPLGGTEAVRFGEALVYGTGADAGKVVPFGASSTADDFVGVVSREVKSAVNFMGQNEGEYQPGEAVSTFKRGCINVICRVGTPALGGKVYIRTKKNEAIPTGIVGGFEASDDTGNTVELPNCEWFGGKDANGVAEIRIKMIH